MSERAAQLRAADPSLSVEQSLCDALADLILAAGRATTPGLSEVVVFIDLESLLHGAHEAGVSYLSSGEHLPVSAVRRLCCEAKIVPMVLGGEGEPLDLGRGHRTANRAQRRALRKLYRSCAHPDCEVPFDDCHVHHVDFWNTAVAPISAAWSRSAADTTTSSTTVAGDSPWMPTAPLAGTDPTADFTEWRPGQLPTVKHPSSATSPIPAAGGHARTRTLTTSMAPTSRSQSDGVGSATVRRPGRSTAGFQDVGFRDAGIAIAGSRAFGSAAVDTTGTTDAATAVRSPRSRRRAGHVGNPSSWRRSLTSFRTGPRSRRHRPMVVRTAPSHAP
ncbi:MAG: DUF222 domain-containing protein [Ilumatobacteraceae bacterium]